MLGGGEAGDYVVFPARAGMNRDTVQLIGPENRVPRTRGDEPLLGECDDDRIMCSPHARG